MGPSHRNSSFPAWPTQPWHPQALELSGNVPLKIRPNLTKFNIATGQSSCSCQQKWHIYCQENNINPVTPNITNVLDFLINSYNQGPSYSALSHIILIRPYTKLSDHPLITVMSQYGKGVFNLRPPRPKRQFVWDVKIVSSYLEEKGLNNILPDKILSQKLLILLFLFCWQRMDAVFNFGVDNMFINTECEIFSLNKILKYSKPGEN